MAAIETARGLLNGQYYRLKFKLLGRRVTIGKFFRVHGPLDIRGPGRVAFGDFCTVASSRLKPTTPYTHSPDALIRFGNRVMLTRTRLGCETLTTTNKIVIAGEGRGQSPLFHKHGDKAVINREMITNIARGVVLRNLPGTGSLRASVGAWNDEDDLARLLAAL